MASVRRSLFASEGERFKFLNQLVGGTRQILQSKAGLAAHENYHELCRLLGRLKTNYQLSELVRAQIQRKNMGRGGRLACRRPQVQSRHGWLVSATTALGIPPQ